jgi:hypothetical protein
MSFTEYSRIRTSLIAWSETADIGPLLREISLTDGRGCVLRWREVSLTLRSNGGVILPSSFSDMDQEFPPLDYVVDKEGNRHYHNEEK